MFERGQNFLVKIEPHAALPAIFSFRAKLLGISTRILPQKGPQRTLQCSFSP
jgi:hypothetical protein